MNQKSHDIKNELLKLRAILKLIKLNHINEVDKKSMLIDAVSAIDELELLLELS